ncbi:putative acyl-CoA transferase/carnitine dehydratase [Frankia sp. EI5c]|uniref:CaiB/BaiF CoA transferase family protein n=1 Tax=Frankia sp. EI5c TaxID=683316 RepID=UPI0007C2BDBC|nr:CoA transferase [Frankia sp. EI5c]OAA27431.1 putative acyl-CoA transferase/carnitine dehydratase [Frankia sp. EI5c]
MRALAGLRVVDLSDGLAGAHCGQTLADFGAEVALVEPPGGHPLRASAAFPFLARGRRSIALDLDAAADLATARRMIAAADILVESFGPVRAAALGLDPEETARLNPRLVHVSITGFGRTGPYAGLPADDAVVMAAIGASHMLSPMAPREGPAFASVPFASFSAAQTALQGVFAALLEREVSGRGQHVETSLLRGIAGHDIWNWFLHLLTTRYADAFTPAPHVQDGVPLSALIYRLLIALSADGRWLQFSQTSRHLYVAFMDALGLGWMFDDPDWGEQLPLVDDPGRRVELWDRMIAQVRTRTAAEWNAVFDERPDVWAEPFRRGIELLDHPQLRHDGNVVRVEDPDLGLVEQPGPIARMSATPAEVGRPAPRLDADAAYLRAWEPRPADGPPTADPPAADPSAGDPSAGGAGSAPLAGLTVLELGMYFAAPYGGSLLADLGARVIKVEPPAGDPLRSLASFPEIGAIKVMQGKECVALDLAAPEGRRIVHELARQADVVIQSFRAGVAERLGVDGATLLAINPDLVYVNAPGYGVDGPCGHRPAYAPTIAAGAGIAWRMAGATIPPTVPELSIVRTKEAALRLVAATNASFAQCDGLSALSVAAVTLLGLVARARGAGGQEVSTSMLNFAAHLNCEDVVRYPGRADTPAPDPRLYGLSARYRLYPTARGWVFLSVTSPAAWAALRAFPDFAALPADPGDDDRGSGSGSGSGGGWGGADGRDSGPAGGHGDEVLGSALGAVLARRAAADWERMLAGTAAVCVAVAEGTVEGTLMSERFGRGAELVTDVYHPMLGDHPRLTALVRFSRSTTVAGAGALVGQHTDQVLAGLGYPADQRSALRERGIVVAR